MQKKEKEVNPMFFSLIYNQLQNARSYIPFNILLIIVQYVLTYVILHRLVQSKDRQYYHIPFIPIFFILIGILAFFILLTIISNYFQILSALWVNILLFLQAIEIIYLQVVLKCFGKDGWCENDPKLKISAILMIIVFGGVIYLRSMCYKPFHNSLDPLSMISADLIIVLFVYNSSIVLLTSQTIISNIQIQSQIVFFLTCILFWNIKNSPYSNPTISRILFVCSSGLLWTSALLYLGPIIQKNIEAQNNINSQDAFWYYWGFSFPIILILSFINTNSYKKGYQWKNLFFEQQIYLSKQLFLQCNNLIEYIKVIRRSQLHIESTQFRQLWNIILHHNDNCKKIDCSLMILSSLKVERGNQLMELKKFTKTIEKTLQYGLQILNHLKNLYPNSIQLNLVIANYELQVFHQKSKGIQLFNKQYLKPERSRAQLWSLYYLKKKIDGFEILKQLRTNSTNEQQIQIFKHDIQSSVSMLAEFWFFLSDPKCNLTKLYDLANDLFPMKIKVDNNWKSVKLSKNIQCYNLYAKYLIKLFNDKQKGIKLLEEAQKIQFQKNEKQEISNVEGSLNEEHGVIFLQFDGKNSGIMYQVNTACQNIFGYGKGQLQGRKVNDIMPKIISVHHDKILQNYQQTNKPKMMNKERVIWGKSKNGYLFPFTICIKPVRNYYSQTSEVYASVKRDLWVKQSAFIFTDTQFNISQASASFIGLFPQLNGRIGLKKKIKISQYIKNFDEVKDNMIENRKTQSMIINRKYKISNTQNYIETLQFSYSIHQVKIEISGLIGYYLKFTKGTGLSQMKQPTKLSQTINIKNLNNQASNTYLRSRQNTFGFITDICEEQDNLLIYRGGLLKNYNKDNSVIISRIKSNIGNSQFAVDDKKSIRQKQDYGHQIKTKRLQGHMIKQVHDMSQSSQINGELQVKNQSEQQLSQKIKQSELNSIFGRQNNNKNIMLLKLLTILLLVASTLLIIFEYILIYSNNRSAISQLNLLNNQQNAQCQILYANLLANEYYYTQPQSNSSKLTIFRDQINQLDSFSNSIPMNFNSDIIYSDKTHQNMVLSFTINKLISEFQLLVSSTTVTETDSHQFFVIYNSINGILNNTNQVVSSQRESILQFNKNLISKYIVFIGISCGIFITIFILKNIIVNIVIKRKAQILNLFFQIPRSTCNQIQKECQKFILRLSVQNEEDDNIDNQDDQKQNKKVGKHKKRTVMGEQKSAMHFMCASFVILVFILIYPIFIISLTVDNQNNSQYLLNGAFNLLSVQKQFSQTKAFLDTHYFNSNYTLNKLDATAQINLQFNSLNTLLTTFQLNLYFIGNILDDQYKYQYNNLFFNNLCVNKATCAYDYDEHIGFNNILYKHFDYIIIKYQTHRDAIKNNITITQLYSNQIIQKEENYRNLFKKYWRQFNTILLKGIARQIMKNQALLFSLMMTFCIINMTFLLWAWFKFYVSLQEKIIATQYILTFIPIDEINKNPKIIKYIKQQILRSN